MSADRPQPGPARRLGALLMATHPEPVAAVTAVTVALSASAGRSARGCLAAGGAALAGQLSVGWCNDVVDRRRDAAAGRPDKPIARGDVSPALGAGSALAALAAAVPLSLLSGRRAAAAHLVAVGLGWGYDLGLKGTAASVVPYAGAFGLLPCFVALGLPGAPAPRAWAVAAAALLGSGAHFANALPDLGDDLAAGVLGLPQRMGGARSRIVAASALTASSLLLALGPGRPGRLVAAGSASAVVLGVLGSSAGAPAPSDRGASRLPFRATMAVAVLDVALLIGRGRALVRPSADGAAQWRRGDPCRHLGPPSRATPAAGPPDRAQRGGRRRSRGDPGDGGLRRRHPGRDLA